MGRKDKATGSITFPQDGEFTPEFFGDVIKDKVILPNGMVNHPGMVSPEAIQRVTDRLRRTLVLNHWKGPF